MKMWNIQLAYAEFLLKSVEFCLKFASDEIDENVSGAY